MSNKLREALHKVMSEKQVQHPDIFTPELYKRLPMLQPKALDIIMMFRRNTLDDPDRSGVVAAENRLFEELTDELHKMPDTKHYCIHSDKHTIQVDEVAIRHCVEVLRDYFTEPEINDAIKTTESTNQSAHGCRLAYDTMQDIPTKKLKEALKSFLESDSETLAIMTADVIEQRKTHTLK